MLTNKEKKRLNKIKERINNSKDCESVISIEELLNKINFLFESDDIR